MVGLIFLLWFICYWIDIIYLALTVIGRRSSVISLVTIISLLPIINSIYAICIIIHGLRLLYKRRKSLLKQIINDSKELL